MNIIKFSIKIILPCFQGFQGVLLVLCVIVMLIIFKAVLIDYSRKLISDAFKLMP